MPSIGERLSVDAVDSGIRLTILDCSIVLEPKEARNLNKVLVNLIPRITTINKEKLQKEISLLENTIKDRKQRIAQLEIQEKEELEEEVSKAREKPARVT